jgi:hypothetical protein
MWHLFRRTEKQRKGSQRQPRPENSVDELANKLDREGRVAELESELEKINLQPLSKSEQESESGTIFNNLIDTTDRDLINYIIKFLKQGRIRDMKLGGDRI